MGAHSSNPMTSFVLAQNYVLYHLSALKIVAMGLDPGQINGFDYTILI